MSTRIACVLVFLSLGAACGGGSDPNPPGPSSTDEATKSVSAALGRENRHQREHLLIADQFNNRVIEVNAASGEIVWQFGRGPSDVSRHSILGVNDAQTVGPLVLMAGTGAPPGTEPLCPDGCDDSRVMLVDRDGEVVWQYGTTGVSGADVNQLNDPNSAELLANGNVLIADEANNRAIEVTRDHAIVATFSAGGTVSGVAFEFNHQVLVVNRAGDIVASYGNLNVAGYGTANTSQGLNAPYDAKMIGDFTGLTPPFGDRDDDF